MKFVNDLSYVEEVIKNNDILPRNRMSQNIIEMCLPKSNFTLKHGKAIFLKDIYQSILTDEKIESIISITLEDIRKNASDSMQISKILTFYLIYNGLKTILNIESKEVLESVKEEVSFSTSPVRKLLLLSFLPIPHWLRMFFLKGKKHAAGKIDSMVDTIYQKNKRELNFLKEYNLTSTEDIKTLITTVIMNMAILSQSISAMIILLLKHKHFINRFKVDYVFAKKCYLETLRLYPFITNIPITYTKNKKCPFSKTRTFILDLYKANRNCLKDGNLFNPNRTIEKFYYFGVGDRKCIGKHISIKASVLITQTIFNCYEVAHNDLPRIKFSGKLLKLENDLILSLKPQYYITPLDKNCNFLSIDHHK